MYEAGLEWRVTDTGSLYCGVGGLRDSLITTNRGKLGILINHYVYLGYLHHSLRRDKLERGEDYLGVNSVQKSERSSLLQRCIRLLSGEEITESYEVKEVKVMVEIKCKHAIHESMKGKELNRWYIYIDERDTHPERKGNLVMALFDQYGVSHDVLAIGTDGKLHLYTGIPSYVEGIKVDEKGRIVVES